MTLISLIDSCTFWINSSYEIHSRKDDYAEYSCIIPHFTLFISFCHEDRHVHEIEFYFTNHYCFNFIISRLRRVKKVAHFYEYHKRKHKTWEKARKCFNLVNFHFIFVSQYFFTTSLFMISCCCCVLWRWIIFYCQPRVGWRAKILFHWTQVSHQIREGEDLIFSLWCKCLLILKS